jgi:hypothetical protein
MCPREPVLPENLLEAAKHASPETSASGHIQQPRRISGYGDRVRQFSNLENRPTRAFRSNLPALDLFPTQIWTRIATRRLQHLSMPQLLGGNTMGYFPLRTAIADYLNASRGVKCVPDQVMVVSGTQEALDLAGRLTLNPGDRVCVEEPGYPGATIAFEAFGAKICSVPVDDEGMKLPGSRLSDVKLVYTTPGHQFPLGLTMSLKRRLHLLEWARQSRALIFEDDYDSEFRYAGRPVPALQGLDRHGVVLYAGSFSKVLFPALRLGYLVLPNDLVERFAALKSLLTRHTLPLEQTVLCDFIVDGHFGRHPDLSVDIVQRLLGEHSDSWSAITVSFDGQHLIVANDSHAPTRRNSNLVHELAHLLLDHEPSQLYMSINSAVALRTHNKDQEEEANWLGGVLLIPREALVRVRRLRKTNEEICSEYHVSSQMLRFRLNATGVDVQMHDRRASVRVPVRRSRIGLQNKAHRQ